ncbi:MAG: RecQ family ATP-dependent DNA helicase [Gemmatimonadetes bacterium]|jgi:ATP-dependent DNA helicase RecQ|nr:RecQ family ATP-dependent DNA helicase [Gemmatimonadota bacterium]MBT6146749.1 RecQ family ATP-dependent DNA helicase [Gemmatimonadota bacterium]MBT7860998.1 RecQ family ATP-dependent DNA helicase [Gemmatimonadota bacterium]
MNDALSALEQHFGFDQFLPGQAEAVGHLLDGHSTAAVFPTGGGKSLCYQLPSLLLPGLTLVVSPLIALMKDQIDALRRRGIEAARLDSSLSLDEYREVMEGVRSGSLRLLYVAPERFNNERFRQAIEGIDISLFAVDEAHCISEWGHNFRPDYLKLAGFAREYGAERVLALTATATPRVLDDICAGFDIDAAHAVRTGFYRPNLELRTQPVRAGARDAALLAAIGASEPGPTIVYVTLQRTAEDVADRLRAGGLDAHAYHAGMKDEDRAIVQDRFMASTSSIVVATIAFGMGVDKADIRYVYHYNLPKSLENYAQEIGRAGRDGNRSVCHCLVCADDLTVLENFVYGDTPDDASVRALVDDVFARDPAFDVSLYDLSAQHDIRPLVLRTLLTRLELDGYLEGGTPFYSAYKFKPLIDPSEITARFDGERGQFIEGLFNHAKQGRVWFQVDPAQAATELRTDRERVIRALDWLGDQQLLEVQAGGVRNRYQRLRQADDLQALADDLVSYNMKREAAEADRLQQVLDLFNLDSCRSAALAAHFGEQLETPCGHCSGCLGEVVPIEPRSERPIQDDLWDRVQPTVEAAGDVLGTPRAVARFLCGLTSPRMTRARLARDPLYGTLTDLPFPKVLAWVEQRLST